MITTSDKWVRLREPFDQLVDSLLVPSWVFDGRHRWREHRSVDPVTRANRTAWEAASQKHVREYGDLLAQAAAGSSLTGTERELLQEVLGHSPEVVHLQSGHGLDNVALVLAGAKSVIGIDTTRSLPAPPSAARTSSVPPAGTSSRPFREYRSPTRAPILPTPARAP